MASTRLPQISLEELNRNTSQTIIEVLGIRFTHIDEGALTAEMPVDHRTHQPFGLLHGGASAVLAETIGSVGAMLCVDQSKFYCVGLEINANHISGIKSGIVVGVGRPIHCGKTTQVWDIEIKAKETGRLVCVSRLTLAVLSRASI